MSPTCSPIASRRHGCSLIDTVVLTLLLAMLVSLVLPGIRLALDEHAKLNCINNLREIGCAYHGYLNAHKGDKRFSIGSLWQLKDYLSQTGLSAEARKRLDSDSSIFSCLYVEPRQVKLLPEARIYVREAGWRGDGPIIPLSVDGTHIRTSQTLLCPPGFVLEMDVYGGSRSFDFNDLIMTVKPQHDGSVKLTALSARPSLHSFDLYDSYGQLLVYDFSPSDPQNSFTFFSGTGPSYAMNSAAQRFQVGDDDNKVLVAEYKKAVCSVVDLKFDWRQRINATDSWHRDCAPRHNGKLNVLFMNGAVKTLSPGDINPRRPAHAKEYWLPTLIVPED